jgi:tRNA pseudouridine55 synthase
LSALHRTAIGPWEDPPPGERVLVQGESLLSWCPSRTLDSREANAVLARRSIVRGEVRAPAWELPPGFPDPDAPVRGLQDGKLLALMRTEGAMLRPGIVMGRGI